MIELNQISKTYHTPGGAVQALRGVTLSVARGEIFGIIGRSGAGKSTLIRCINMLESPDSGSVFVDNLELSALPENRLRAARKDIGMIFQHFNLLSARTVYGNVAFPLELAGKSRDEIAATVLPLLDMVGLGDKRDNYPGSLSGGQKQRVGIARALASSPKVLLCDEATSALDPQTTKAILQLLRDIRQKLGITIVLITHEMQVIKEICDRVAVMDNGAIVEEGRVLDVFTNPGADITKDFISTIINHGLPDIFADTTFSPVPVSDGSLILRLTFLGAAANEPVIAEIIRRYSVDISILHGNIDHIQDTPFGTLIVRLSGDQTAVAAATNHFKTRKIGTEVIGYAARNSRVAG